MGVRQGQRRRLRWFSGLPAAGVALAAPVALMLAVLVSGPAQADSELQSIYNQIETLRQQLKTTRAEMQDVQRTVYSGAPPPENAAQPASAELGGAGAGGSSRRLAVIETRVDEYDVKLRQMFGRFDELTNQIDRLGQRIEKLVADVDFRLNALEASRAAPTAAATQADTQPVASASASAGTASTGGGSVTVEAGQGYRPSDEPRVLGTVPAAQGEASASAAAPTEVARAEPAPLLPAGSPHDQYSYAMGLMQQSQWDKADLAFEAFIAQNTGHPLVENAAYWRGESFYARRMFAEAARLYALNFQNYPGGGKASANLVKLALSLVNLERFPEACQAFDKLAQDFPELPANVRQAAERGRAQAGCS